MLEKTESEGTIKTEFAKCVSPVRHDQQNLGRFC